MCPRPKLTGDGERDVAVDIVETETDECDDMDPERFLEPLA